MNHATRYTLACLAAGGIAVALPGSVHGDQITPFPPTTTEAPSTTTSTSPTTTSPPSTTDVSTTLPGTSTSSSVATPSTTSEPPPPSSIVTTSPTSGPSSTTPVPSTLPLIPPDFGCRDRPATPGNDCTGEPALLPATGAVVKTMGLIALLLVGAGIVVGSGRKGDGR